MQLTSTTSELAFVSEDLKNAAATAFTALWNRSDVGFTRLPDDDKPWVQSKKMAEKFKKYKNLGVIGIGGSSVGTEAVIKTLNSFEDRVLIFDTPNASDVKRKLNNILLEETAWYIVSKSGNSLETLFCTDYVADQYEKAGINFTERCVVCTELNPSPLYDWAVENKIEILELPKNVGGRFSVLTPVGLFPFAFCGIDLEAVRQGAQLANKNHEFISQTAAQILSTWQNSCLITYFWFYSSECYHLRPWIHQLWAESLGKSKSRKGHDVFASVPFVAIGPQDQHSIQQQVLDGRFKKACVFFSIDGVDHSVKTARSRFENSYWENQSSLSIIRKQAKSTYLACEEKKIPSLFFEFPEMNAYQLGFLLQWFQLLVGTLGEALDINAFDQPAVEIGKKLTKEALKQAPKLVAQFDDEN